VKSEDMVVLVTGAGRGGGEAIAKAFLEIGAFVYALDIDKPVWRVEPKFEQRLERVQMSVTDESGIVNLVEGKGINVLVNNAGISHDCAIQDLELDNWHKVMDVNAMGTVLCSREVVRHLLANKKEGRIINISSIAGKNSFPNNAVYSASKAAIIGMTRSLAAELAPQGINVNAICPGSLDTEMLDGVIKKVAEEAGVEAQIIRESFKQGIPTRRFQSTEELAALCVFLASDAARSINGEAINLDGGVVRD
jgi:NAD(P)-dependent dehydrogenase (short-subunit alcohol dehydrogenase family)